MKDFLKKLGRQQEPEDLDTGYDSDYYGGAYTRQPTEGRPAEPVDDRYERDMYGRDDARDRYDDDNRFYRETYTRPAPATAPVEIEEPAPANAGTLYFTPTTYRDHREEIVTGLAENHVVVVNVKLLEAADTVRLFDYVMGAVLALEADMTRLNNTMLLLAPKDVEVTEEDLLSLFAKPADTAEFEEDEDDTDELVGYEELADDLSDEDLSF